jgi:hypothetical protein
MRRQLAVRATRGMEALLGVDKRGCEVEEGALPFGRGRAAVVGGRGQAAVVGD